MTSSPAPENLAGSIPTEGRFALRGRVVTPHEVLEDGVVVVDGDRIAWVGRGPDAAAAGYGEQVAAAAPPADGATLLPGLVDLHNHGGGGASFPDAESMDEARTAIDEHLRQGTTSQLASLVTAERSVLLRQVALLADLADAGEIAGIHLEGPFLSEARRGAHNPVDLLDGDSGLVRAIAETARGHLRTMTVAPELPGVAGAGGVIDTLVEVGALPSFGHTDATIEQTDDAIAQGRAALAARSGDDGAASPGARPRLTATHLFNGMRPLHHRAPGPVASCLAAAARGEIVVELIADGTHVVAGTVRSVFDLVGADQVALVTDAMAAAGMPDGTYQLGPMGVTVANGVARLGAGNPEDSIAGGTYHLIDVVRETVAAGVPLVEATRAASLTPAGVLGRADIGALEAGRRADVVVTDGDLRVQGVWRAGVRVAG